jgi:hypothetical protein
MKSKILVVIGILFCVILAVYIYGKEFCIQSENCIFPKRLSQQQQQICDLISTSEHKMFIYSFNTEQRYKNVDFWIEVYNNGKIVDSCAAEIKLSYDDTKNLSGEFVAIINQIPDYQWTLIYAENGGTKANTTSTPNTNYNKICNAYQSISQPVEIENDKEIILYMCVFSQESTIEALDIQNITDPNYLKKYEYVHLLKCKFSN